MLTSVRIRGALGGGPSRPQVCERALMMPHLRCQHKKSRGVEQALKVAHAMQTESTSCMAPAHLPQDRGRAKWRVKLAEQARLQAGRQT